MQVDRIIEKANKLGINTEDAASKKEKIEIIASEIGIDDLENLNLLENKLDDMIANEINDFPNYEGSSNLDTSLEGTGRFGEREFNKAKDEDGIYNKDYYNDRQKELDNKVAEAKEEKGNNWKKQEKEDIEANPVEKTKMDRLKDKMNVMNAKKDAIQNKVDDAKAKAFAATHPKELIKDKINSVKEKAKKEAKAKVKNAVVTFIKKNPYVLLAVGIILLVLFIILLFAMEDSEANNCSPVDPQNFSLTETELTRDEFVSKMVDYFQREGIGWVNCTKLFNYYGLQYTAETMYDVSLANGMNPEVTIARAIAEGCSPSAAGDKSTPAEERYNNITVPSWQDAYNLWGIRCYAGGYSDCAAYSSFEEGIEHLANIVADHDNLVDLMARYIAPETAEENARIMVSIRDTIFYDGNKPLKCTPKNTYMGEYPIDPNDELYKDLDILHEKSFSSVLSEMGMTVEDFEELLKNRIERAGVGTREGTVTAAMTLIGTLASSGYKLDYDWGGKWGRVGVNGNWGASHGGRLCNHYSITFGGENPVKRAEKLAYCYANYKWYSFDCSGFVTWAVINGIQREIGQIGTSKKDGYNNIPLDSSKAVCEPGDALVNEGHIILVVDVDEENKQYITAESTGANVSTNRGGVILNRYSFSGPNATYVCKKLDSLYTE